MVKREDDDDPVVRSINVFLSTTLTSPPISEEDIPSSKPAIGSLVQLPAIPVDQTFPFNINQVMYKPKSRLMEMSITTDFKCSSDSSDSDDDIDAKKFTQTFTSNHVPHVRHQCVGLLENNELHLVPYSDTFQLRYSFRDLDKPAPSSASNDDMDDDVFLDHSSSNNNNNSSSIGGEISNDQAGNMAVELAPVQFKRKDSERTTALKLASFKHLKQREDQESWKEVSAAMFVLFQKDLKTYSNTNNQQQQQQQQQRIK